MKVSWFTLGRIAIFLRRIAVACERSATAAEAQADLIRRMWEVEHPPRAGKPTKLVIGKFDQEEANRRWRGESRQDNEVAVESLSTEERE